MPTPDITSEIQAAQARLEPGDQQIARVIVGQKAMVDGLLVGLLTGGHMLRDGVPGLAKAMALRALPPGRSPRPPTSVRSSAEAVPSPGRRAS